MSTERTEFRDFSIQVLEHLARIGKAIGHPGRLGLLENLTLSERSVEELATMTGLSVANTSQHLQHLKQAGLLTSRKSGLHVFYRASGEDVARLTTIIRAVGERHLADVQQLVHGFLDSKDDLEAIPSEELIERLADQSVTLIDVRPEKEFASGHIDGAINIPMDQLLKQLNEIPSDTEVVAYCRGPHCILAFEAVTLLREQGLHARRLQEGYLPWAVAGHPTATDTPL